MSNKVMLIINPVAGRGSYKNSLSDILEILCQNGCPVTVYMTRCRGDATELVRRYAVGFDIVACCGGDGTLSETIAGLMELEDRPHLGYIPMGTANDVAATLGISRNPREAVKIITEGNCIPFDVGSMNGEYFTYISAFGAFTQVSYETPAESKQVLGHLAYILEGVGHLGSIVPHHLVVEHDGGRIEGEYVFGAVTNTTSIAGLVKLKSELVSLGDGEFEIILVKNPKNLIDLNTIFVGLLSKSYNPEYVQIIKTSRAKFTFDEPVRWTRDGEDGGEHQQVVVENIHMPISFIVSEQIQLAEQNQIAEQAQTHLTLGDG